MNRCPYCQYLCNDDTKVCPMCDSVLPPTGAAFSSKYLSSSESISRKVRERGISFFDNERVVEVNNPDHFKGIYAIDNELKIPKLSNKEDEFDSSKFFSEMKEYLYRQNVKIDDGDLSVFLSSLSAGKVMFIDDFEDVEKFIAAVNGFFGNTIASTVNGNANINGYSQLFGKWVESGEDVYFDETELLKGIYVAEYTDSPYLILIRNESALSEEISNLLFEYENNKLDRCEIIIDNIDKVKNKPKYISGKNCYLPDNIRFIVAESPSVAPDDREKVRQACPRIAISVDTSDYTPVKSEFSCSDETLSDVCEKARASFYLQEKFWRCIDKIEKFASARIPDFRFDNVMLRKMETLSSMMLSFGASENDAFDRMMFSLLLPSLENSLKNVLNWQRDVGLILKECGFSDLKKCLSYFEI